MAYQLFPPVKKITYRKTFCEIDKLRGANCTEIDAQAFSDLPENLIPVFTSDAGVYCYRIGQVGNCPVPEKTQGYVLQIEEDGICVTAIDPAGLRYGVDTLRQILNQAEGRVNCLEIQDYPTMLNRGLMLDISR